jgi:hypothetical protein
MRRAATPLGKPAVEAPTANGSPGRPAGPHGWGRETGRNRDRGARSGVTVEADRGPPVRLESRRKRAAGTGSNRRSTTSVLHR